MPYVENDVVAHNGLAYRCVTPVLGSEPGVDSNWEEIDIGFKLAVIRATGSDGVLSIAEGPV